MTKIQQAIKGPGGGTRQAVRNLVNPLAVPRPAGVGAGSDPTLADLGYTHSVVAAQSGSARTLGIEWTKYIDVGSGDPYWHNSETDQTTWDDPEA